MAGALYAVGAGIAKLTSFEQQLTSALAAAFPSIPSPRSAALRVTDRSVGLPHAHAHPPSTVPPAPPIPLPSQGPVIKIPILSGADTVFIENQPAARCGDMGLGLFCGGFFPMYEVFTGSSSVWLEGARQARSFLDVTWHCMFSTRPPRDPPLGPMVGMPVQGASRTQIGGFPMPSLTAVAMALGLGALFKGAGALLRGARAAAKPAGRAYSAINKRLFKKMKPGFVKCKVLRAEPVDILTGAVNVEQQDFVLPGRMPIEWTRSYTSDSLRVGLCGQGWETLLDSRLELNRHDGTIMLVHPAIGPGVFVRLPIGLGSAHAETEFSDGAVLIDEGSEYRVRAKDEYTYVFSKALAREPSHAVMEFPLVRVEDACGNTLRVQRDGHRPVALVDAAGRRLEFALDRTGRLTEVALVQAQDKTRHVFVRYEYDPAGDLIAVIDALGAPYRFAYEQHRMLRHTNRTGLSFYYEYTASGKDQWQVTHAWGDGGLYDYRFEYDEALKTRRITDSLGEVSLVQLNAQGLPIAETDPLGGQTLFEYDARGRASAVVDPAGRRTAYRYDERGNLLEVLRPDGTRVSTEFDAHNRATHITDPNGATWRQEFDKRGLVVAQISPLAHTTRYEYDTHGQLSALTNARGARTAFSYDAAGYVNRITNALGHERRYERDGLGNILAERDELSHRTEYQYDAKGRLTRITRPGGAKAQFDYDAEDNLIRHVDEKGAVTRFEYFGQGELARRIQADGHSVAYLYDTEERLIGVRNQRGETYHLKRDPLGRIIEEIDYWGQATRYGYDTGGSLAFTEDPLQRRITFQCDPLGRILRKSLPRPQGEPTPWVEHFGYDAAGNLLEAANEHVALTRRYDAQGQLLEEVQAHTTGERFTLTQVYDEVGNRTERHTAAQGQRPQGVRYHYDALDQAIAVQINDEAPIQIERDALGQSIREQFFPGLTRQITHDAMGRVTGQILTGANERRLFSVRYDYDPVGSMLQRTDTQWGMDRYVYDPLDRVREHVDPAGKVTRFLMDAAGDRIQGHQRPGREDGTASQSQQDEHAWPREARCDQKTYRYDRAGNLVFKEDDQGRLELHWDANQRLVKSRKSSNGPQRPSTTVYGYDPLGRRLFKHTGDARTWFGWDGWVLAHDAQGPVQRTYVYRERSAEPIAAIAQQNSTQQVMYYVTEPNGAPTCCIDRNAQVTWAAQLECWGRARVTTSSFDNPIRLQGQYFDTETSLHYNCQRYFDPDSGAFTSIDPIGLEAGENVYQFAPNTQEWIDPLGLSCKPVLLGRFMDARVKPVARAKGWDWYKSKPRGASRINRDLDKWEQNNVRWLKEQIRSGRPIYDIGVPKGVDPGRFVNAERNLLRKEGFRLQRRGPTSVDGETYQLFEWVK